MEYYLGIKRNKLLVDETTWMNFKSTVLSERARYKMFYEQNHTVGKPFISGSFT